MKADDIIRLLDAGYTREEIISMEETPAGDPDPAPEETPEGKENEKPENDRMNETLNSLVTVVGNLQKTVDAMQKKNAANAESKPENKMTADDVIKSFFAKKEQKSG